MPLALVIIISIVGCALGLFVIYFVFNFVKNMKKSKAQSGEEKHVKISTPLIEEKVDEIKVERSNEVSFDEPAFLTNPLKSQPQNEEPDEEPAYEMYEERESQPQEDFDDDDFESFRSQHCYSRIFFDQALMSEIEGMSPQMKAILFSNFFGKLDD